MSESGLDAYWRFFETFNTRDAHAFSSAMSYPHVRVSWAREPIVLADQEAHALSVGWDAFIKSGWDHTVGSDPEVIGHSDKKVHIAGGWTRFTASNKPILTNKVCYIATCVEGRWGIQSRFGTDPGNDSIEHTDESRVQAQECVRQFLHALDSNKRVIEQYTSDEFFVISVGEVRRVKRGSDPELKGMRAPELRVVQSGQSSMTVNAHENNQAALIYAVRQENKWKVKAGSWL